MERISSPQERIDGRQALLVSQDSHYISELPSFLFLLPLFRLLPVTVPACRESRR